MISWRISETSPEEVGRWIQIYSSGLMVAQFYSLCRRPTLREERLAITVFVIWRHSWNLDTCSAYIKCSVRKGGYNLTMYKQVKRLVEDGGGVVMADLPLETPQELLVILFSKLYMPFPRLSFSTYYNFWCTGRSHQTFGKEWNPPEKRCLIQKVPTLLLFDWLCQIFQRRTASWQNMW